MSLILKLLLSICILILPCCFKLPVQQIVNLELCSLFINICLFIVVPTKRKPKSRMYIHYLYFTDGDIIRIESKDSRPITAYLSSSKYFPHKEVYDTYTL